MANEKQVDCNIAVRGFHYYRKIWKPKSGEKLYCMFEVDNPFDIFAIKTCKEDGTIVGHLPREISRVAKFILDRGASITAELISDKYRRSPLVQGEIEIESKIVVKMIGTLKNMEILTKFSELVKDMYSEPEIPTILGSILADDFEFATSSSNEALKRKVPKKNDKRLLEKNECGDIRKFFRKEKTVYSTKTSNKSDGDIMIID